MKSCTQIHNQLHTWIPPTAFCFFLTRAGLTLSTLWGIALCWMFSFELAVFWLRLPCHILEVTAAEAVGRPCHSNPCDCKPWRAMFQETSQQITSNLAMRQLLIAWLKNKKAFIYCSFETIFHCSALNVDFLSIVTPGRQGWGEIAVEAE